jgi:hypothetical protein
MAELTLEQIQKLQEEFTKLKQLFESGANTTLVKDQIESVGSGFGKLNDLASKSAQAVKDVAVSAKDLVTDNFDVGLGRISEQFDKLKNSAQFSGQEVGLFLGKMLMLSPIFTRRIDTPNAFKAIGEEAGKSTASINNMLETTLKLFSPDLAKSKIPGIGLAVEALKETSIRADFAKNFEVGILQSAAATGQFSEVLKTLGTDLSGLSLKTDAYSKLFQEIGNSSGLSSTKVAEYAAKLRMIPGALDNFAGESGKAVENYHFLDAAIKTATGTGQDFNTVMEDLNFVFTDLGTRGKPALEIIAQMANTADATGLPLEKVRDFTRDAAGAFKFLGDNASGAIKIMAELGPSLQASGLGPGAINNLVKGVTNGISQMSTAQKSFLSSQTGGSGGLQGAFQIDLMLRQGKLDEVFGKVQQNLKQQIGGPIVSLEDASKDAGSAAQFQKQLALIKSPAMGGIAKSDAEAMRILEAFAAKDKGVAAKGLESPEDAFKTALQTGDSLQERQNSLLTVANNWAERQSQIQSVIAYNTARQVGGDGTFRDYMRELKDQSKMAADKLQPNLGEGTAGGSPVDERLKEAYTQGMKGFGDLKDKMFGYLESQTKEGSKAADVVVKLSQEPEAPKQEASIEIPRNMPISPNQFADRTLQQTEQIALNRPNAPAASDKPAAIDVNVNHTTVCSECQARVATKAAQNAIGHYHSATEQSYRHNNQSPF